MEKTKILLISISANMQNGNPYVLIEKPEWAAETIYYTYFDEFGKQIGRRKSINLIASPSNPNPVIPESLRSDIMNPQVVKLFWNGNTRIFASAVLGKPKHNYIPPENWIDIKALLREYGYNTDSLAEVASKLRFYNKQKCKYNLNKKTESEANRFSVLIGIVQRLFRTEVVRTKSASAYEITESVNDQGVLINTDVIDAALYLIELYEQATFDYMNAHGLLNSRSKEQMVTEIKKDLKQDLFDKNCFEKVDEIYQLLSRTEELSELEIALIHILKFFLSRTYNFFSRLKHNLCDDNRLRGQICYWNDLISGTYGGTKLFEKANRDPTMKPEDIVEAISSIEHVDITDCELILNTLKTLRTLLIEHEHPYVIVDLSRVTEKTISKISNSSWRKKAYEDNNLEDVLKEKWTNFPFTSKRIVEYDIYVAKYGYSPLLCNNAITEWKEFNIDLSNGQAMLYSAFVEAKKTKRQAMTGIQFYVKGNLLILSLPTGRRITIPFKNERNGFLHRTVCKLNNELIDKNYLFRIICTAIQREALAKFLSELYAFGCTINYFTNNEICMNQMDCLPSFLFEHDFVKVYEYS